MDYTQEKYDDVVVEVVNLSRATLKEAMEFKEVLTHDIAIGNTKIVVDLSDCEFIDSTFLGALVVSLKRVIELGGEIRLIGFHPAVNSMFHLTRLDRVFEVFKTKEDAIKSYKTEILHKDL
jgi:anti-anti-sigma factor